MGTNAGHSLVRFFLALLISCMPSFAAAQIPQFDSMYVFGDSLADNGNILLLSGASGIEPPVPPSATPHRTYFEGRFSNGYIGFEYLWQRLTGHALDSPHALRPFLSAPFIKQEGAIDFAFGGTGTAYMDQTPGGFWAPGLQGQVELFRRAVRGRKPSDRSLFAIATGANDYRVDPFNVPMTPAQAVLNIEEAIISLYRLGARNLIVLDLPDLGLIPGNAGDPGASDVSRAHNALLDTSLRDLQIRYPKLHLIPVTLDPLFHDLRSRMESRIPALEVFAPLSPGMSACLFINPAFCQDVSTSLFNTYFGFLFWDVVHPTTEAHRFLGDYLYEHLADRYE